MITVEASAPALEWLRIGTNAWQSSDGRYFVAAIGMGTYLAKRRGETGADLGVCNDVTAAQARCQKDAET